jgi:dTDP-4-dehydrorhamnose 3,5-epimerase
MKIIQTNIIDCVVIEPLVHGDNRGFFLESYQEKRYQEAGIKGPFVQDNHSRSSKGVLRGLHMQISKPQGKLVRVVSGEVFDVAVDLRKSSSTYMSWHSVHLSEKNKKQFWVPPGFAHGFLVLSDFADFEYKCTEYYDPKDEISIQWNDPKIGIQWPDENYKISEKDASAKSISSLNL